MMRSEKKRRRMPEVSAIAGRRVIVRRPVRGARSGQRRRTVNRILGILCFCLCAGAIGHVSYGFFQDMPYFRLSQLKVEGLNDKRIQAEVESLLDTMLGDSRNMLNLNLGDLTRKIQEYPRIRNLHLEKVYPDTLILRAAERQPEIIVVADDFFFVDREGFVIEKIAHDTPPRADFPYVTGIRNEEIQVGSKIFNPSLYKALDLAGVLRAKNPDLYSRFSEIHIERDNVNHLDNLTAFLKGGMKVLFGNGNPVEKLPSLDFFLELQKEQKADPFQNAYVDLRFKDQIVFMDRQKYAELAAGRLESLRQHESAELENLSNRSEKPAVASDSNSSARNDDDSNVSSRKERESANAKPRTSGASRETAEKSRAASKPVVAAQSAPPEARPADDAGQQPAAKRGLLGKFAFWRRGDQKPANNSSPVPSTGLR
ncbi:MAG: FtsQ-type POTRA domain-containing protein [Candidatus Sumerlaeaceae bacterium]|nr:FtsQ-type POTRA domain-containing protein [Candidatus Sumerlaeaceae bacterium]